MMAVGLLYWGIFGTALTIVGGILHKILPLQSGQLLGRKILHQLFKRFVVLMRWTDLVRADLSSLDALKDIKHPCILAPNHTSLWDAVFIISRSSSAVCVMKQQILNNPVLGGGARLAGYIANSSITHVVRQATASLHQGGQLLLFPEGTRTKPDARWTNPIKGGCAIIALRADVPVYPIFIRSSSRFLQKGWPLWKRPVFPIYFEFELGEPIYPHPGEKSQDFTARLGAVFEQELSKPHPLRRQIEEIRD